MATSKSPDNGGRLRLLSLDGGGVRGLSTLYVLKDIMVQLNKSRLAVGLQPNRPCDVFDLIGGTSTGGLIAIMLGRLHMDVDECISAYVRLIKSVFSEKQSRSGLGMKLGIKARFSSQLLEKAIKQVLQEKGYPEDEPFNNCQPSGCRVMVCACAKETKGTVRIRSYASSRSDPNVAPTVCQAALATSAATQFFDPVTIGARTYVDGALGANNPLDEIEGEASDIWYPDTGISDLQAQVSCFISIGTGVPGKKPLQDNAVKFAKETLVRLATETEKTANRFASRWRKQLLDKKYYRFNVQQGLQDVGLQEFEKEGIIESTTEEYLSEQDVKFRVADCVRSLEVRTGMLSQAS
ncbi:phospholipase [Polyplosphaeria fusca]|uniref:Phospholipase n=1 Tax=Polyplosphaeria fusca TaxID=682080 RepID=A0A9P4QI38_9PLEO|nr:phospholipase [Polyplosphaeria fusca]